MSESIAYECRAEPFDKIALLSRITVREPELSRILSVPARTIRLWRSQRILPYYKVGAVVLYDIAKVRSALEQFERKADK